MAVGFPKTLLNVKELSSTSKSVKSGAWAPITGAAGKAAISSGESPSVMEGLGPAPEVAGVYVAVKDWSHQSGRTCGFLGLNKRLEWS